MVDIKEFWKAVLSQNRNAIRGFFRPDAWVNWHNTNEHFSVDEFIRANCEYPGLWAGEVEREIRVDNTVITVTHVHTQDGSLSFHVTSFIQMEDGKIASIEEYWGDDGDAPLWRQELSIGSPIREG